MIEKASGWLAPAGDGVQLGLLSKVIEDFSVLFF